MAYTTINKPTDYFNTKLYTGNGSTQTISSVGFQPDLLWNKSRSSGDNHLLFDAVRGITKTISSDLGSAEATRDSTFLTSFDSDGFTVGSNGNVNGSGTTFANWCWKANGAGSANTDGSISSTVSANTTSGFSIVSYTGTGSLATVGHSLSSAPSLIIIKNRSTTNGWEVYHQSIGNTKYLALNVTDASVTSATRWNDTSPTSTVFTVNTEGGVNSSGGNLIAYCFAEKQGYSKFGSFVGSSSQQFIYLGFKPRWFLWKNTSQGSSTYDHWGMVDTSRQPYNGNTDGYMRANQSSGESSFGGNGLFFLSNGIQFNNVGRYNNNSGDTYIYMAFAEAPLVGTNNVPCTAR